MSRIPVFPLLVAIACACGSSRARGPAADDALAARRAPALFAHVPADTPYFVGGLEAIPRAYFAKLGELFAPAMESAFAELRAEGDEDGLRLFEAVRAEFAGKWNRAGLESLGFSTAPRFAVYAVEGAPLVARLEIRDDRAVLATARRIAQRAGLALPDGELRGASRFWRVDEDGGTVVIAIADRQLVIAAGKTAGFERALPAILGLEKPKASMADGRVLTGLARRHRLGPHVIGFVDMRRAIEVAIAAPESKVTGPCAQALHGLAARFPRLAVGFRDLTVPRTTAVMVLELAPDLATELQSIRTPFPGLRDLLADKPMLAFAAAMDIPRTLALARRAVAQLRELGTVCENDKELVEDSDRALARLDALSAIPPALLEIAGIAVRVDALVLDGGTFPRELEAVAAIASTKPKQLFELAQKYVPWLASLRAEPDATLQPLAGLPFHIGIGPRMIAVLAGERDRPLTERLLVARADRTAPLFAFAYDHGWMLALRGQLAASGDVDPEKAAEYELDGRLAHHFGRAIGAMDVTPAGLVFWMSYEMK